ncbi:MAG: hypothetical protein H6839_00665 [Planctomycetes bacterium]|nr:hypothetical protein [Planctomycetota bacterium]
MLEFAREQWLWLFALVGVFYVAWWFARRYRKRRVTYGLIWQRVARRVLPPGWKRILRTILTLLVSGLMLTAIVLKAAGLQKSESDQPAPLLVFILVDNSPSMRALEGKLTRAQLAQQRAQQIVDKLGQLDRAALVWRQSGQMLVGPWLKRGDAVTDRPRTDWSQRTPPTDLGRVPAPPALPTQPTPERVCIELTDSDDPVNVGVTMLREAIGTSLHNDGIKRAVFEPPAGASSSGSLLVKTHFGADIEATLWPPVSASPSLPVSREPGMTNTWRVVLPIQAKPLHVRASVVPSDPLNEDNDIFVQLDPPRLATVTLCYPAEDGEPNDQLEKTLRLLLPGREISAVAMPSATLIQSDLVVCDRALPASYEARYLMCFGVLPAEYGRVGLPVAAEPNMQLHVDQPDGLGFDVPDLTLLYGEEAVPLEEGHSLIPLAKHMQGGTLVGVKRASPELLYIGFIPHLSSLLLQDDWSGVLLLSRWLAAIQGGSRERLPLFVQAGEQADFELARPGTLSLQYVSTNPWAQSYGPRAYSVTSGPDGRGKLGPFEIPGEYVIQRSQTEVGRLTAFAPYDPDLTVPNFPPVDLDGLFQPSGEPDWRDHVPGALLWIALGLMVLEWLLWLVGVTE